jgi:hypothetical protein
MRTFTRSCAFAVVFLACAAYVSITYNALAQVPPVQAGQVIISELRYRGPNGIRDEFIEIYNNTDQDIFVQDTAPLPTATPAPPRGWALVASDGNVTGPVCLVPEGTRIPARGHFLCANEDPDNGSGYSLGQYPSGNPDLRLTASAQMSAPAPLTKFAPTNPDQSFIINDIPDGFGIALFSTVSGPIQNAATRLDAFGLTNSPALFKEGNGFPVIPTTGNEHTLYRDLRPGTPRDTNDNATDFRFVATSVSIQATPLGAPGPENLNSPIVNNTTINGNLLDPTVGASSPPNRERRPNVEPNANLGVLLIRRMFTNNTGQPVTRLRFRVVNITTRGTPVAECGGSPCADVRALTSQDGEAALGNGQLVTVRGVRLESDPPITPDGGGLNSSLSADFITLDSPLLPGFSVNIVFKLGVMATGPFRFFINIEAQNGTPIIIAAAPSPLVLESPTARPKSSTPIAIPAAAPMPAPVVPPAPVASAPIATRYVRATHVIVLKPARAKPARAKRVKRVRRSR